MADEFQTVTSRRGDRAREIEVIRQQYRHHRETLHSLAADAPTEHLANEYNRLVREIDMALGKLNELEGRTPVDTNPVKTAPGMKPLVASPVTPIPDEPPVSASPGRLALIVGAGLAVLAVIAWLMWRASSDERPDKPVVTETAPVSTTVPIAAEPVVKPLLIEPASHDYGTIRKGTRAARQFEIANNTAQPLPITIARSSCRCLYYDYAGVVPPNGKETITVTIDGARAPAGTLQEIIEVTSKRDQSLATSLTVTATVR